MRWSGKRPSMPKKYQLWLHENRWWINTISVFITVLLIAIAFRRGDWLDWVGFRGKTVWDWLDLLGVPLTLVILGYLLQQQQQARDKAEAEQRQKIAAIQAREEILQSYFDRLSSLLLDRKVLAIASKAYLSEEETKTYSTDVIKTIRVIRAKNITHEEQELLDSARDLIRTQTLSILRRFEGDGIRKGSVIRFLIEADIIHKLKINLSGADLNNADLRGINLRSVNLSNANLRSARLRGADLSKAILHSAYLDKADLSHSNLFDASLQFAKLRGANLCDANLNCAILAGANFEKARLRGANLFRTNLSFSNLNYADLSRTDLSCSYFYLAEIHEVKLNKAIIAGTDLRCTDGLKQIQFTGNDAPIIFNSAFPDELEVVQIQENEELLKKIRAIFRFWGGSEQRAAEILKAISEKNFDVIQDPSLGAIKFEKTSQTWK